MQLDTKDMKYYSLTNDGYHYVIAADERAIEDAVTQFVAYIAEDPTRMYRLPQTLSENKPHTLALSGFTVSGVPLEDDTAIVYPAVYDNDNANPYLKEDLEALSYLIFCNVGVSLPLISDQSSEIPDGPVIRIGVRADEKILAAGDFSYVLDISENGIIIDSQDIYGDTRGIDLLYETIASCAADGVTAIDASHGVRRVRESLRKMICAGRYIAVWRSAHSRSSISRTLHPFPVLKHSRMHALAWIIRRRGAGTGHKRSIMSLLYFPSFICSISMWIRSCPPTRSPRL